MGATDMHHEGGWVWMSGAPWNFESWAENEPNQNGNEDCGAFDSQQPGFGVNENLFVLFFFLDEKDRWVCANMQTHFGDRLQSDFPALNLGF